MRSLAGMSGESNPRGAVLKFEYATVAFDTTAFLVGSKLDHETFTAKLNEYGSEGWELVNTVEMTRRQGSTFEVVAVFKRPME